MHASKYRCVLINAAFQYISVNVFFSVTVFVSKLPFSSALSVISYFF